MAAMPGSSSGRRARRILMPIWLSLASIGPLSCQFWLLRCQGFLDKAAGFSEVHRPRIALLQGGHHLAHVFGRSCASRRDDLLDGGTRLFLRHLLGHEFADYDDFVALASGEFGPSAGFIGSSGIFALLDHARENAEDFIVREIFVFAGDALLLHV